MIIILIIVVVFHSPGDALFFHCNLLHSSSENSSAHRRWALAVAYNRADNNPIEDHHHPKYTKLNKVRAAGAAPSNGQYHHDSDDDDDDDDDDNNNNNEL